MPEISRFTVPVTENGVTRNVTYDFKDSTARSSSGGKGASGTGTDSEIFNNYTGNDASGYYSHAEGSWTTASASYTHAEGCGTIAAGDTQHVQGKYNRADTSSNYAFIIGNGTNFNSRSNAFAVDWNGLIYVGNSETGIDVSALEENKIDAYSVGTDGSGNVVTGISTSNNGITLTKGITALTSSSVDSSGSTGTSGWYNCRLYNGKIQYYNTDTNTTYSTTSSVTSGSSALVTSGGVYSALLGTSVTVSSSYGTINRQGVKRLGDIVIGTCQLTLTTSASGKVDLITGLPSPSAVRDAIPFKKSNTFRTDDCWITTAGQYRVQIATGNALSSGDVLNFIFAYVI